MAGHLRIPLVEQGGAQRMWLGCMCHDTQGVWARFRIGGFA